MPDLKQSFSFEETPSIRALHFLNHMSFNKFKGISAKKCKNEEDRFDCFNRMKNYVKTALDSKGVIKCEYGYSSSTPPLLGGRLYSNKSIQGVAVEIRGLLFKHTTDLDIVNCQPTLLLYLCIKNNIPCKYLKEYVENRDEILASLSSNKAEAKHIILCSMNDSKKIYRVNNNEFFRDFDNEMKDIQNTITFFPEYKPYRDAVPDDKHYNETGSTINRILCGFENQIIQCCIEMIQKTTKYTISTLMFDGFLLNGDHYNNRQLLRDLEIYIESLFPGINIKFSYKKHDDSIVIPDNFDYNVLNTTSLTPAQRDMLFEQNHHTAAKVVVELIDDVYKCVDKKTDNWVCYNKQISLWETGCSITPKPRIYDIINQVVYNAAIQDKNKQEALCIIDENCEEAKSFKKKMDNYLKFKNKIGSLSFINSVYSFIKDDLYCDGFLDKLNRELFNLPILNNQVINLKTNEIYPRERNHNFSVICPVEYDEKNMGFAQIYFETLFPDASTRKCVLDAIKSSMTGLPLRNIFIWIGIGCNGKSLLLKIIRKLLSDFCGVVSKNIIINSKSNTNISSELESLSTLRFAQISELSDTDSLNDTRIKEFTGDGIINYRGLFQKEKNIEVTASVHIATNNMPSLNCSDRALLARIIPIPFKAMFEPNSDYETLVMKNIGSIFTYIVKYGEVKKSFIIDNMSEEIQECRRESIIKRDFLVSFVQSHIKPCADSRLAFTDFIEHYEAFLTKIDEECYLTDKKIMGLLRKMGFVLLRSNSIYYILNIEIINSQPFQPL